MKAQNTSPRSTFYTQSPFAKEPDIEMGARPNDFRQPPPSPGTTNSNAHAPAQGPTPAAPSNVDPQANVGSQRFFTPVLSRNVTAALAGGVLVGGIAMGIYAGTHVHTPYSSGAIAGMLFVLPMGLAGLALLGSYGVYLRRGHVDNTAPAGEPFVNKKLGRQAAIAGGVGLLLGAVSSAIAVGVWKHAQGTEDRTSNTLSCSGAYDCHLAYHEGSSDYSFPTGSVVAAMLCVPLLAVALEMGRNALKHDWRRA